MSHVNKSGSGRFEQGDLCWTTLITTLMIDLTNFHQVADIVKDIPTLLRG
ncbi:hypothetical protein [Spirosoma agri]|uniref:Uncharacterized protein n=1 Tax=Spirosoma agri TaxID=1987381 RepID=A0A6M0IGJ7_9BACT|nr:hypothetical protein [Spirosoma agri]NEU67410.1 hypothetical protein [Spirosoma agri]